MGQVSKSLKTHKDSCLKIKLTSYNDFSAKISVTRNGRMADDNKRMRRTTSERGS